MDNIWILLIIIGAVASYAQKNQENRPKKRPMPSSKSESDIDPHEAFERRLRELLGDKPTPKHRPDMPAAPDGAPRKIEPRQIQPRNIDIKRKYTPKPHRGYTSTLSTDKPLAGTLAGTLEKKQAQPAAPATKQDVMSVEKIATQKSKNSKIGHILEDFSMDKAVIYSEILKPKFEEY